MFHSAIVLLASVNGITIGWGVILVQEIDLVSLSSSMSFTQTNKYIL